MARVKLFNSLPASAILIPNCHCQFQRLFGVQLARGNDRVYFNCCCIIVCVICEKRKRFFRTQSEIQSFGLENKVNTQSHFSINNGDPIRALCTKNLTKTKTLLLRRGIIFIIYNRTNPKDYFITQFQSLPSLLYRKNLRYSALCLIKVCVSERGVCSGIQGIERANWLGTL